MERASRRGDIEESREAAESSCSVWLTRREREANEERESLGICNGSLVMHNSRVGSAGGGNS